MPPSQQPAHRQRREADRTPGSNTYKGEVNVMRSFEAIKAMKSAVLSAVVVAGMATGSYLSAQEAIPLAPEVDTKTFTLRVNPAFQSCLGVTGSPKPKATVTLTRGQRNDTLTISGENFKPGL